MFNFAVNIYLFIFYLIQINTTIEWCTSNVKLVHKAKNEFGVVYDDFVYILGGSMKLYTSKYPNGINTYKHPIYKYRIQSILSFDNSSVWTEVPDTDDMDKYLVRIPHSVVIDDKVYIATGSGSGLNIFDLKNERYIDVNTYNKRMPIIVSYDHCSATVNNIIYVIGGRYRSSLNSTQIYDVNNDKWSLLPPDKSLNIARMWHACAYSNVDQQIYVFNGGVGLPQDNQYTNTIETYDVNSKNGWKLLSFTFDIPMSGMYAIEYHANIYIIGGVWGASPNRNYTRQVRKFNVITKSVIIDSYLNIPSAEFGATMYNDKILIFGGVGTHPRQGWSNDIIQIGYLNLGLNQSFNGCLPKNYHATMKPTTVYTTNWINATRYDILNGTNTEIEKEKENKKSNPILVLIYVLLSVLIIITAICIIKRRYRLRRSMNAPIHNNDVFETNANDTYAVKKFDTEMERINVGSDKNDGNDCVICMEPFIKNQEIVKIHCGHLFHKQCAVNWIYENPTCPLCRVKCSIIA